MIRQVWIFLDESDERALLGDLARTAGVRFLRGRFFRGTEEDLRRAPEELETADVRAAEHSTYLLHPTASARLVVNQLEEGPMAGWSRLDDVRSDVVAVLRPDAGPQGLAPGRIQAATHAWFGGAKLRKPPEFTRWVAGLMKQIEATYPQTQYDWLRVAPGAREWAEAGGRLHYLFKEVALKPA